VIGGWRRLHNEKLHNLYTSPSMIRMGHVASMVDMRNAYEVLVRKPGGKRLLGRHRRRWEDNIGMNLRYIRMGKYELDVSDLE